MKLTLILITVAVGTLMPLQAVINGKLGSFLPHKFHATTISFLGGALIALAVSAVIGMPSFKEASDIAQKLSWWHFIGGLLGIGFVFTALSVAPLIGVTAMSIGFISGQILMGLTIDHFGLFAMPVYQLSWKKVLGVGCFIVGLFLTTSK